MSDDLGRDDKTDAKETPNLPIAATGFSLDDILPDASQETTALVPVAHDLIEQAMQKVGENDALIPKLTKTKVLVSRISKMQEAKISPELLIPARFDNTNLWSMLTHGARERYRKRLLRRYEKNYVGALQELQDETMGLSRELKSLRPADDPSFRCVQEYSECRDQAPAALCLMSFLVCILRQFLKVQVNLTNGNKEDE